MYIFGFEMELNIFLLLMCVLVLQSLKSDLYSVDYYQSIAN